MYILEDVTMIILKRQEFISILNDSSFLYLSKNNMDNKFYTHIISDTILNYCM